VSFSRFVIKLVVWSVDGNGLGSGTVIGIFVGQMMGSLVGSSVFLKHGWRAYGGLAMGFVGISLSVLLVRGPLKDDKVWFGWKGEWRLWKEKSGEKESTDGEGREGKAEVKRSEKDEEEETLEKVQIEEITEPITKEELV
jgi:hypothetical protein